MIVGIGFTTVRHFVDPLVIPRQPVKDVQIRSVGYDRRRGTLEIEFTWTDDVRQFCPVSPIRTIDNC
jgi:hypothetical protein